MADWIAHVPKTYERNLEYRLEIRKRATKDTGFRRAILEACKEDVLFFYNSMVWLHEPRDIEVDGRKQPHVIPFITREHQDVAILELRKWLGKRDIGLDKARGEGASYIMTVMALYDWLFKEDVTIGLCSATEDKSDIPDNRGTLMGKIDWQLKSMLPRWMAGVEGQDWARNKTGHTLRNFRNSNLVVAYAATGGTGRGDRYLWFLLDELAEWRPLDGDKVLASLQAATESRVYVSTPQGPSGTYYDVMHKPSNMAKIVLDWKDNRSRNRGLYRLFGNKPIPEDPFNNPLPAHYDPPNQEILDMFSRLRANGFKLEGKVRSPWYDRECDRSGTSPQQIAQEYDRDYEGSAIQFFGVEFFKSMEKTVRVPSRCGRMLVDEHDDFASTFEEAANGEFQIWCELDIKGRPPKADYVVAADISSGLAGLYTSNSVLEVYDTLLMEQVGEMAVNWVEPTDFAEIALGTCRFFWDALLIWETNYGGGFTKRVVRSNYPRLYRQERFNKRKQMFVKELGWRTTPQSKQTAFDEFKFAVQRSKLGLRSRDLMTECSQYILVNGMPEHAKTKRATEGSQGMAHGDRVIAAAIGYQAIKKSERDEVIVKGENTPTVIPENCMYTRHKRAEEEKEDRQDVWDSRSNWDLVRR